METTMNKLELIGYLGGDAKEITVPGNENKSARFNVAYTRQYRDKEKKLQEKTTWFTIVAWNIDEKQFSQLKKGTLVRVIGSVELGQYTNKDGETSSRLEVTAKIIEFPVKE